MQGGNNLQFVIQEVYREAFSESAIISSGVIERMIRHGQFNMSRITVQLSSQLAVTRISLCLDDNESYTISRFPRSLLQDEDYKRSSIPLRFCRGLVLIILSSVLETRQNLNKNSSRWASRTPSQQIRRKNWVPPDLTQEPKHLSTISRYSDSNYVLGNSSPASLGRFARLFMSGSSSTEGHAESEMPHELPSHSALSPGNYDQPDIAELDGNNIFELGGP